MGDVEDELRERVDAFAADLASAGIHIGLGFDGAEASCPTCGEPWPCAASTGSN